MRLDFAEGSERARSMATWVRGRLWGFGRGGKEGREEGEVAGFWLWGFVGGGKRKEGRKVGFEVEEEERRRALRSPSARSRPLRHRVTNYAFEHGDTLSLRPPFLRSRASDIIIARCHCF